MKPSRILAMLGIVALLSISGSVYSMATDEWTYYINPGAVADIAWHDGTVWCATGAGLYEWDTTDLSYYIHTANDGLPHNSVTSIDIAPDGVVWAGTLAGGVAKYENGNWQSFSTADGLPYNKVVSVATGSDSSVWIGTYGYLLKIRGGGITWYNGENWSSAAHDTYNVITEIATDSTGKPYMIGNSGTILYFDGTNWTVTATPVNSKFSTIALDANDSVWSLSQSKNQVFRLDGDQWAEITVPFPEGYKLKTLKADSSGTIWCATEKGGIAVLSGDTPFLVTDGGDTSWLTTFTVDDQGTVWAGTSTGGMAYYTESGWAFFDVETFTPGYVHAFEYDRNGSLYAAGTTGLFSFQDGSWATESSLEELLVTYPRDSWEVFFNTDNTLWAKGSNGLWSFDGVQWTGYKLNNNEFSWCNGALSAGNGMLWTGWSSDGNLFQFNPATSTGTGYYSGYHEPTTPELLDSEGTVWCVVGDDYDPKLFKFHDGGWQKITLGIRTGISWQRYTGFIEDSSGNIWISVVTNTMTTHYPIYLSDVVKYDGTTYTVVFENTEYLSLKTVDSFGGIWLTSTYWDENAETWGTQYNGILHYDGESVHRLRETEGLPSNHVNDIIDNGDGSLWIATDKGICRYRSDLVPVGVEQEMQHDNQPESFSLITNYPNPFNPSTTITYTLEQACVPELAIYSITGQKIRSFQPGSQSSGQHSVVWDGRDEAGLAVSSGVYICRMKAGGVVSSTIMTLMR